MGISKAYKRKKRRAKRHGGTRHRLQAGRTGSVRHKQRKGMLIERRKREQ